MNYELIKKGLEGVSKELLINNYLVYLKELKDAKKRDGTLINYWIPKVQDNIFVNLYKKSVSSGLVIDGDSVTITFKGKPMLNYNFQAYKNLVLIAYPETTFDMQLVYKGDEFNVEKKNGKVFYHHNLADPFGKNKEIIGTYIIIKNSRGEFIETLNLDEITKMKNVAKTQMIWNSWYGEMVLKSVIKRGCKRHFKDIVQNIEKIDNEHYDLDKVDISSEIQEELEKCTTQEELTLVWENRKSEVDNEQAFVNLIMDIKKQKGIK